MTERRFLTVTLNRELGKLLGALAQEFPQLGGLACGLSGKTETRALHRIGRLHRAIPRRLKVQPARSGEQAESDDTVPEVPSAGDGSMTGTLAFIPGAFVYRGEQHSLSGKPLQVLQALYQASGRVMTLRALHDKVWHPQVVGDEAIRSAVKVARRAIRAAMQAAKVRGPEDPIPPVDRGSGRTAWRLDLP